MDQPRKKARKSSGSKQKQLRPTGHPAPGVRIGRRNVTLFLAGLGAIVLGFIALRLGAGGLAAVLLVGGYLGLVPWAILAGNAGRTGSESPPPPKGSGGG